MQCEMGGEWTNNKAPLVTPTTLKILISCMQATYNFLLSEMTTKWKEYPYLHCNQIY